MSDSQPPRRMTLAEIDAEIAHYESEGTRSRALYADPEEKVKREAQRTKHLGLLMRQSRIDAQHRDALVALGGKHGWIWDDDAMAADGWVCDPAGTMEAPK